MSGFAKRSVLGGAAIVVVICACSPQPQNTMPAAVDRSVITPTQFADYHFNSAFDAVAALRANWFNTKGPDSFTKPSIVRVYLDNVLVGDTGSLRMIPVTNIVYMKYFDGVAATARWGLDNGAGAIFVSTRPISPQLNP